MYLKAELQLQKGIKTFASISCIFKLIFLWDFALFSGGVLFAWMKLLRTFSISGIFFSFLSCVREPHASSNLCFMDPELLKLILPLQ